MNNRKSAFRSFPTDWPKRSGATGDDAKTADNIIQPGKTDNREQPENTPGKSGQRYFRQAQSAVRSFGIRTQKTAKPTPFGNRHSASFRPLPTIRQAYSAQKPASYETPYKKAPIRPYTRKDRNSSKSSGLSQYTNGLAVLRSDYSPSAKRL